MTTTVQLIREIRKCRASFERLLKSIDGDAKEISAAKTDDSEIGKIQSATAKWAGISVGSLLSGTRREAICFPRQVAMYLTRKRTQYKLTTIGERFGGYNHGTVLNAVRKVADRISTEPETAREIARLEQNL